MDCNGSECNPVNCALHAMSMHTVWQDEEKEEQIRQWPKTPANVEMEVGLGSGQVDHPFTTSHEAFARRCESIGFSPAFLRNLRGKQPLFECRIQRNENKKPEVLELAISTYETDAILILVRYDIASQVLKGLVFFKQMDSLSKCDIRFDSIIPFLDERKDEIEETPLIILPILLSFLQFRSHNSVKWRVDLHNAEGELGVTRRRDFLDAKGYRKATDDFAFLNAHLASTAHELDDTVAAAKNIQLLLQQTAKVVRICDGVERCPSRAELMAECRAVNAQLYAEQVQMSIANMQTLRGALYSRMGAAENRTAKSIAMLGLVVLPTMLVSNVFATGILNLQGTYSNVDGGTVSKLWPWFLSLCVGLTALMFSLWTLWERCGARWLEKLGNTEIQKRWRQEGQPDFVPQATEMRKVQKIESEKALVQFGRQRSFCSDGYICMKHGKKDLL